MTAEWKIAAMKPISYRLLIIYNRFFSSDSICSFFSHTLTIQEGNHYWLKFLILEQLCCLTSSTTMSRVFREPPAIFVEGMKTKHCEECDKNATYFDSICFFVQQALGCCLEKESNAKSIKSQPVTIKKCSQSAQLSLSLSFSLHFSFQNVLYDELLYTNYCLIAISLICSHKF